MLSVFLIYSGIISLIAVIFFGFDKLRAKKENAKRVPEVVLLSLISLGGAFGGFIGMYLFRHKTIFSEKFHFAIGLWISLILQIATAVFIVMVEHDAVSFV